MNYLSSHAFVFFYKSQFSIWIANTNYFTRYETSAKDGFQRAVYLTRSWRYLFPITYVGRVVYLECGIIRETTKYRATSRRA